MVTASPAPAHPGLRKAILSSPAPSTGSRVWGSMPPAGRRPGPRPAGCSQARQGCPRHWEERRPCSATPVWTSGPDPHAGAQLAGCGGSRRGSGRAVMAGSEGSQPTVQHPQPPPRPCWCRRSALSPRRAAGPCRRAAWSRSASPAAHQAALLYVTLTGDSALPPEVGG